jgi:Exonuclease
MDTGAIAQAAEAGKHGGGHLSNGPGQMLKATARKIVALVDETEGGVSRETLLATAQSRFPRLPAQVVTALVAEALAAGALVETDGVLRVPGDGAAAGTSPSASGAQRGRIVIVDLESVVRTTDVESFTDKRIFQLGAVRVGADEGWTAEAPVLEQFLELPDATWEIRSPEVRERHAAAAVPPADALTALHTFCIGADVVVTYNGTVADMPMLADAFAREDLPVLDVAHVDAYYLALALWPTAPSHRLAQLCDDVGVDRTGLGWHDAVDDAKLLARLISRARAVVDDWPADQRQLVAAVCGDSAAWALVLPTDAAATATAFSQPEVAAVLGAQLGAHIPRRQPGPVTTPQPLVVDDTLRDSTGRVNPGLLGPVRRRSR